MTPIASSAAARRLDMYDDDRTPQVTSSTEQDDVRAAQHGDHEAFAVLVRRHERRAHAVAIGIVGSPHDAEDVVQEAFSRAYRGLARFRLDQSFGAWLHRIVVNAALDLRRRRAARAAETLSDAIPLPFRDPGEAFDLRTRLSAAVADLGRRQRSVLVLHDIEGFTHGEIGVMLGIPEGTARSLLHHARHSVRMVLAGVRNDL